MYRCNELDEKELRRLAEKTLNGLTVLSLQTDIFEVNKKCLTRAVDLLNKYVAGE